LGRDTESTNPKKVTIETLMENYGEIGKALVNLLQMKLLFFIPSEFGLAEGLYPAEKIVV